MTASTADRSPDPRSPSVRTIPNRARNGLDATLDQIARFADLQPDWDSYDGDPPSSQARVEAGRWAEIVADLFGDRVGTFAVPYSVAPLANGGVQLEWRSRNGVVELEVGPEGGLGYLLVADEEQGKHVEEADDATWSDVLRALSHAFANAADTDIAVIGPAQNEYNVSLRIDSISRGKPLVDSCILDE